MGTDNRHKKQKVRNTAKKRLEQKAVLIALEDTKSSKYYFDSLLKDKKLMGKVIFAKHIGTDPNNVIEAIVQHEPLTRHTHCTELKRPYKSFIDFNSNVKSLLNVLSRVMSSLRFLSSNAKRFSIKS